MGCDEQGPSKERTGGQKGNATQDRGDQEGHLFLSAQHVVSDVAKRRHHTMTLELKQAIAFGAIAYAFGVIVTLIVAFV